MRASLGAGAHSLMGSGVDPMRFADAVATLANVGFEHLMLLGGEQNAGVAADGDAPDPFPNLADSDLGALSATVARHGMRVSSVFPGCPIDYSSAGVDGTVERLLAYREITWRLGCSTMIIPTKSTRERGLSTAAKRQAIELTSLVMNALACDDRHDRFTVAVDVHHGAIIETVEDCRLLLSLCPCQRAGICLNMGHLSSSKQPGWELLEECPERVPVVAWKDHRPAPEKAHGWESVPLGQGVTELERYRDALVSGGCQGMHLITVEHAPAETKVKALQDSVRVLRNLGV